MLGLALLSTLLLENPVPNPGSGAAFEPWCRLAALGVRVNLPASGELGSGPWFYSFDLMAAKQHEAWALADLGPVQSKLCIKRIK